MSILIPSLKGTFVRSAVSPWARKTASIIICPQQLLQLESFHTKDVLSEQFPSHHRTREPTSPADLHDVTSPRRQVSSSTCYMRLFARMSMSAFQHVLTSTFSSEYVSNMREMLSSFSLLSFLSLSVQAASYHQNAGVLQHVNPKIGTYGLTPNGNGGMR
jgi:hypothetical protein